MRRETVNITRAVDLLEANLMDVARVTEWANLMGYKNPKKFSRRFLRHYTVRPQPVLEYTRLKSIIDQLRNTNRSNFDIARTHGIPDEKGLNKFTNYHLDSSPTDLKKMPEQKIREKLERLGSKVR
ncbi:hypothetical protein NC796_05700 [Aliifodinibius sp. S!AR15-10]|uniref:hypothetical protein n=1 Tax=Aliifodinibius sp. S!AR15-10 TaxID=2950437 RepID=UPI0028609E56|nr:hypothetical protein [Aliifodinibius sp. S!AR15-10]MDR8390623.1 hypothetical protein [Aliifodinibius sp. S!AR15-10]